jgi:hypothetical protein
MKKAIYILLLSFLAAGVCGGEDWRGGGDE